MLTYIKKNWAERPLAVALFAGGFFRLLAVIFSKGFGMHDDHFLVIEAAQSWVDGHDYNDWLPSSAHAIPSGHSFFYVGLHYLFFKMLHFMHIDDPETKMFIVRFVHALLSMYSIVLVYRITLYFSNKKNAGQAALLMALLFFMPILGVRNLVEVVCVPFLLLATWQIAKHENENRIWPFFVSGIVAGLSFSIRFQCLFFIGGMGLYLLVKKQWSRTIVFGAGVLVSICLIQGGIDYYNWGYPFAEFIEYVKYNMENAFSYFTKPWYMYLLLIGGILIPPVSLFLFFGYLRNWKKNLLLFLPSFIFLVYHSYFPNKQERFIFPVIPFIIMAGVIGWNEFMQQSSFWQKRKKLYKGFLIFFWTINTIPLCVLSVSYIKKDRIESMRYLSHKKYLASLVIEDSNHEEFILPTLFYLEKWPQVYGVTSLNTIDTLNHCLDGIPFVKYPNYVIFVQDDNLDQRLASFQQKFAPVQFETTIHPGMLDAIMHWLNPVNKYQSYHIYKIIYPENYSNGSTFRNPDKKKGGKNSTPPLEVFEQNKKKQSDDRLLFLL